MGGNAKYSRLSVGIVISHNSQGEKLLPSPLQSILLGAGKQRGKLQANPSRSYLEQAAETTARRLLSRMHRYSSHSPVSRHLNIRVRQMALETSCSRGALSISVRLTRADDLKRHSPPLTISQN